MCFLQHAHTLCGAVRVDYTVTAVVLTLPRHVRLSYSPHGCGRVVELLQSNILPRPDVASAALCRVRVQHIAPAWNCWLSTRWAALHKVAGRGCGDMLTGDVKCWRSAADTGRAPITWWKPPLGVSITWVQYEVLQDHTGCQATTNELLSIAELNVAPGDTANWSIAHFDTASVCATALLETLPRGSQLPRTFSTAS